MRMPALFVALGAGVVAAALWAQTRAPRAEPPISPRVVNTVTSFAQGHPEWAVLREGRRDLTALHFNHARHLAPDLTDGPLECVSCHQSDDAGRYMRPIRFDQHCQRCHTSALGEINVAEGHIPAIPVAHGSTAGALAAIDAQLNALVAAMPEKFALSDAAAPSPSPRGRRGASGASSELPKFATVEARTEWLEERREEAVADIRAENHCGYCHASSAEGESAADWRVDPPEIPARWMPRSHFSHQAHAMLTCVQCHGAPASAHTEDVLMPSIDSCRECHSPRSATGGGAPTDCVLCHVYHAPAPTDSGGLMTRELLSGSR